MLAHQLSGSAHLRLLEEHDARELYALIERNRAYLSRWMPWAPGQTETGTLAFIRQTRRQLADNDGLQTAIVVEGSIAGMVGLHGVAWEHSSTSIGYWLAEEHQGCGLVTTAVSAYAQMVFDNWELNRLELSAATDNARSRAVAERVGFREEGIRREAETVGDRRHDLALYGLLAAEWRARTS